MPSIPFSSLSSGRSVPRVTPETVKDQLNITEADLKAAYEAKKDTLGEPARRRVQQIALPDMEAAKKADKE